MSTRATEVRATVSSCGQNRLVSSETVKSAIFHIQGNDTNTFTVLHDEIQCEIFDEEVGVVTKRLSVKRVEERMAGSIRSGSTTIGLPALAEFQ